MEVDACVCLIRNSKPTAIIVYMRILTIMFILILTIKYRLIQTMISGIRKKKYFVIYLTFIFQQALTFFKKVCI